MAVERRNGALAILITGLDWDTLTLVAVGEGGQLLDARCQFIRPGIPISSTEVEGESEVSDETDPKPSTTWNEGNFTASDVAHQYSAVAMYQATKELDSEPIVVYQDTKGSIVTRKLTDSGWNERTYGCSETRSPITDTSCP